MRARLTRTIQSAVASLGLSLCAVEVFAVDSQGSSPPNGTLTNMSQLGALASASAFSTKEVRLEGVLTWAAATGEAFVLQDSTGAMRFECERAPDAPVKSGQRVRLDGRVTLGKNKAVLRHILFVEDDGEHAMRARSARQVLKAGRYGFRLEYFQSIAEKGLKVSYEGPNLPRQPIPATSLFHKNPGSNWLPGLRVDYFEGQWKRLPDFDRLTPVRTGTTGNFEIIEPNRGHNFALRWTGAIEIPVEGEYRFYVASDDGSRLSFDEQLWRLTSLEPAAALTPQKIVPGQILDEHDNYRWSEANGVAEFPAAFEGRCQFDLVTENGRMRVEIASVGNGLPMLLPESRVRIQGACAGVRDAAGNFRAAEMLVPSFDQVMVERLSVETWRRYPLESIGGLAKRTQQEKVVHLSGVVRFVESGKFLTLADDGGSVRVETPLASPAMKGLQIEVLGCMPGFPADLTFVASAIRSPHFSTTNQVGITPVEHIRLMKPEDKLEGRAVKIRGVITAARGAFSATLHDGEYGISCWFEPPAPPLNLGDYVEVSGVVRPGAFGPNLGQARAEVLGKALLPKPLTPTWERLINGSLEQQWVEIEGVVQKIEDRTLTLEMTGGRVRVELAAGTPGELAALQDAIVRIRGTVQPLYNTQGQLQDIKLWVSSPLFICVEEAAKPDPFSAPLKTLAELTRFDPGGAKSFYRVKVHGQVLYADDAEVHLSDGHGGLSFQRRDGLTLNPGDWVDVVGFPEFGGAVPSLREALARKTGHGELPAPKPATVDQLLTGDYESNLVQVDGVLLNVASSQHREILEVQSGRRIFTARLAMERDGLKAIPLGSSIRLTGVCVGRGWHGRGAGGSESVEVLLNSTTDVKVLQLPPWWNTGRLIALFIAISVCATSTALIIWSVSRRRVKRRLELLARQRETERDRARIAKDMHDEIGAKLTRISYMSELAKQNHLQPGPATTQIDAIAETSRELLQSLDEIVWAVNPRNDTLEHLAAYLGQYANEYFQNTSVECFIEMPAKVPDQPLTSELRHNLYLAFEESLTNVLKHAEAQQVRIEMNCRAQVFEIAVTDDGKGLNFSPNGNGQSADAYSEGLRNMRQRLADVGGTCEVDSVPGKGTIVRFAIPLKPSVAQERT